MYVQRQKKLAFNDPTKLPNTNAANHRKEIPECSLVNQDGTQLVVTRLGKNKAQCLVYSTTIQLLSCQFLLLIFTCGSKINFSLAATQVNPSTTSA